MKLAIGFVIGIAAAISVSAFAQDLTATHPWPTTVVDAFMMAGGNDADGVGHKLQMTKDGRVLAKCD